tara:strand:+ start:5254 stop:5463 length:210 start_codon:yes stop_codon:yes gene_type:complete
LVFEICFNLLSSILYTSSCLEKVSAITETEDSFIVKSDIVTSSFTKLSKLVPSPLAKSCLPESSYKTLH